MKGKSVIPVNYERIQPEETVDRITQIVHDCLENGADAITIKHQVPLCNKQHPNINNPGPCKVKASEFAVFKVNVTFFA